MDAKQTPELDDLVTIVKGENEGYTGVLVGKDGGTFIVAPNADRSDDWFSATEIKLFRKAGQ